jgi:hypothetical protein
MEADNMTPDALRRMADEIEADELHPPYKAAVLWFLILVLWTLFIVYVLYPLIPTEAPPPGS